MTCPSTSIGPSFPIWEDWPLESSNGIAMAPAEEGKKRKSPLPQQQKREQKSRANMYDSGKRCKD